MTRPGVSDVLVGAALCAAAAVYLALTVVWTQPPYEDAAMLLRYAVHVAGGHGMVWNIGDPPLDGATDLLFTLAVAGTMHLGISAEAAARVLGVLSHLITVGLVFFVPRRLYGASIISCALGAIFIALGPARTYISSEFGTTFFALWVAIAWAVALVAAETGSRRAELALPVLAVVLGMARPEGAILGGLFLAAVAIYRGGSDGRRLFVRGATTFALLGAVYFLARWRYFGHPLPNPFYIKGGGHIFVDSLIASVRNFRSLTTPFLPLLALGLASRASTRRLMLVGAPVAIFIGVWILLSDEMNFNMRFQYAVVPLVLMTWPGVALSMEQQGSRVWTQLSASQRTAVLAAFLIVAGPVAIAQHKTFANVPPVDGRRDLGVVLAGYQSRGYTIVVSEAGLLPLYSGWKAIDAWGLNDAEIAHTGRLTADYLDRVNPAVISFHAYFSPASTLLSATRSTEHQQQLTRWDAMTVTLRDYAESHGYQLAACFGLDPHDTHFYYVKTGLPDSRSMIDAIRSMRYFYANKPATDYSRPLADTR